MLDALVIKGYSTCNRDEGNGNDANNGGPDDGTDDDGTNDGDGNGNAHFVW